MPAPLPEKVLAQLFTEARTHHAWLSTSLSVAELKRLYDLLKWGPTSLNSNPARFLFLTSAAAKEKLISALDPSNIEQVRAAPVAAIIAQDTCFHARSAEMFPAYDATTLFSEDAPLRAETAFRNSSLQGAYAILAARALGYDTCPMSGFDRGRVDEIFFKETSWKSNFLLLIGHGDGSGVYPRGPRLSFEVACRIQ